MEKDNSIKPRVLVVDDEESICEILQFNLEIEGFDADIAFSAREAMKMIEDLNSTGRQPYSLIILDVMMDETSGFRFAHNLKKESATSQIPIIFCTAKDSDDDIITGFNIGADDYVTKPFSMREMMARVRNVIRRNSKDAGNDNAHVTPDKNSGIVINELTKICMVDGHPVNLTKKELQMLELFMNNKERVFSREELLDKIWNNDSIVTDRTIDVNIARLRKKIEPYGNCIVTRQGFGYGLFGSHSLY